MKINIAFLLGLTSLIISPLIAQVRIVDGYYDLDTTKRK